LENRTILLHAEQGLGDTIQFVRYAPLVKARGGRVLVECRRPLLGLLKTCPGIDRLVVAGDPLPAFDVHAPLLSLPGILGTVLEAIPCSIPYLTADPALVAQWRDKLAALDGVRVGIAWQGNPQYLMDRQRSIPLAQFAPLADLPGVRLISLQKGPGAEQIGQLQGRFPVVDWTADLDERSGPFMDTAAILANLDLVILSDSVLAHLAGALGVTVWMAVPKLPDWRWLLDGEDSPWYPTMRLFRQQAWGNWPDVFQQMRSALTERIAAAGR
jgi:hypothetical protein